MATIVPLRGRRYPESRVVESHMEAQALSQRLLDFTEDELRTSFASGDIARLRRLQSVHQTALALIAEHRRQAGMFEARCADGKSTAGHGAAA